MNAVAGAVAFIDLKPGIEDFERAVLEGLSQQPKWLPARYFYDERGSQLFEEICKTEEYYLTRTELALLDTSGSDIADLAGSGRVVVEYGSGSSAKIKRLLGTLDAPAGLVAIDISATPLRRASAIFRDRRSATWRPPMPLNSSSGSAAIWGRTAHFSWR